MISKRLQHIIDMVPKCNVLADIGTDHGYIPVNLIQNSKVENVIASDISKPSLKKAQDYVKLNSIQEKVSLRQGDGLNVLSLDEADAVVIAGMGGILISKILDESYDEKFSKKIPTMIFQPVQHADRLRYYLYRHGFVIKDEDFLVENGKYYDIILATKSYNEDQNFANIKSKQQEEIDVYLKYGLVNIKKKSPVLLSKIKRDLEKLKKLVSHLKEKVGDEKQISSLNLQVVCMEEIINDTWGSCKKA